MERKIKYIIVEDEENSREILLKKIQICNINDITCIGIASTAKEAILLAKLTPPDFILLDINLPGKNGFDLIREFEENGFSPDVIFTSAHTEPDILLTALKHSPITYLEKPIDIDELELAIRKVCNRHRFPVKESELYGKIRLQGSQGPVFIPHEELLLIKAEGHYSRLYVENGKEVLINQSISEIEKFNLQPYSGMFIKPDRSTIINLSKISSIHTKNKECLISNGADLMSVRISGQGLKIILGAMDRIRKGI